MRTFTLTVMSAAVLVLASRCSSGPGPGPSDGGGGSGGAGGGSTAAMCTFTGGKSGAVGCSFTSATWTQASNKTTLQIDSASGASTTVSAQFVISGTPSTSTYSGGAGDTECTIDVTENGRHWGASTAMALGGCALMLRSVRPLSDGGTQRDYDMHGGFSGYVEPDDGDGGTVTITSSF